MEEYDELGERIPEGDDVCEVEGLCSVEIVAIIVVVPCVTVNKGVIEASEVGLTKGVAVATGVPEGLPWADTVIVNSPEVDWDKLADTELHPVNEFIGVKDTSGL